jgi:hypothetical protein
VDYSNLQFKTNRKTVELSHSIINKTENNLTIKSNGKNRNAINRGRSCNYRTDCKRRKVAHVKAM